MKHVGCQFAETQANPVFTVLVRSRTIIMKKIYFFETQYYIVPKIVRISLALYKPHNSGLFMLWVSTRATEKIRRGC